MVVRLIFDWQFVVRLNVVAPQNGPFAMLAVNMESL
jgi:hypothetical protein